MALSGTGLLACRAEWRNIQPVQTGRDACPASMPGGGTGFRRVEERNIPPFCRRGKFSTSSGESQRGAGDCPDWIGAAAEVSGKARRFLQRFTHTFLFYVLALFHSIVTI